MKIVPLPSREELWKMFEYEPETGRLKWLLRSSEHFEDGGHTAEHCAAAWNGKNFGRYADEKLNSAGYRIVSIRGQRYRAHRKLQVAWRQ